MAGKVTYSTILSTRAQKEILKSWEWYEDRQQGLGDQFFNETISRIHEIEQNPDRYPIKYKYYRETLVVLSHF